MKMNKSAHELLQRYLLAVKRELSGKQRDDITAEIESYILDRLEEQFPAEKEITERQLETVLMEMGSPRKVAGQYSPHQYLIGPRLISVYFLVLKILVAVVVGALTLSMVISSILDPVAHIWQSLLEYLGSIWSGSLSAVGVVTLIFAIIERTTEGKSIEEIEELSELKISDLPQLPEEEKEVSKIGTTIEIILGFIGMVFFIYMQKTAGQVPTFYNPEANMPMVRVFTENFLQFVPFILALNGLEITRNITLLVQGHHSALTNWWFIALKCADVVMLVFLISSLPLISLEFFRELLELENLARLDSLANTGLAIAMGLGILGSVVDVIRKVGREIANPTI